MTKLTKNKNLRALKTLNSQKPMLSAKWKRNSISKKILDIRNIINWYKLLWPKYNSTMISDTPSTCSVELKSLFTPSQMINALNQNGKGWTMSLKIWGFFTLSKQLRKSFYPQKSKSTPSCLSASPMMSLPTAWYMLTRQRRFIGNKKFTKNGSTGT